MDASEPDAVAVSSTAIMLRLELDPGEPIAGTLLAEDAGPSRFCGWIDLMAAITAARSGGEPKDHRFP